MCTLLSTCLCVCMCVCERVCVQFESGQKLIVFVSSCEAVEFLLTALTAVLCGQQDNADTPKKTPPKNKNVTPPKPINFLRLHGNMKQGVRHHTPHTLIPFILYCNAPHTLLEYPSYSNTPHALVPLML